ncbi:Do/DeqQ family periplasmic serine protease [Oleiphilus messinensis]|uniref:Do/DeqQ family periplasmic serine protease n=1 Tax=Oleiphilus messinensis TaxID=141451 RepID=A0A1Y0I7N7_9GAMM|nr:serine protease [Oleiphilus messinensis]ARU56209.1 Do/DeqQ family periplasmic serine protease [Oleiphilus messinensis]
MLCHNALPDLCYPGEALGYGFFGVVMDIRLNFRVDARMYSCCKKLGSTLWYAVGLFFTLQYSGIAFADPLYQLPDTIQKLKPSIVGVGSYNKLAAPRSVVKGTGFAIMTGQHILTNYHVIAGTEAVQEESLVIFVGQGNHPEVRPVRTVAHDKARDLAVLEHSGAPIPPVTISDQEVLREGDTIAFTGYPIGAVLGLYPVTHRGIISSITPIAIPANTARGLSANRLKQLRKPYYIYQLDATAYPGNSGSPLYDPKTGLVHGILNKVFVKESKETVIQNPSGITYAIPLSSVQALWQDLVKK